MIILDTDHVTVLRYVDSPRCATLTARIQAARDEEFALSVITMEEQLRGWLAAVKRHQDVHDQVNAYQGLIKLQEFLEDWDILPFDEQAADTFKRLRKQGIRIGSQDLKIASIALVQDALLLSANLKDFFKVPDLRVENWLD